MVKTILLLGVLMLVVGVVRGDDLSRLLAEAKRASDAGMVKEALDLANQAVAQAPKDTQALLLRGNLLDKQRRGKDAFLDFTQVIELDPKQANAWHARGMVQFKLGNIAESIADFDKHIELRPDRKAGHWQRGISYYYAGRYDDGRKQFEGYQTVDSNDVENAVWRFMCMARADNLAKARADMLKVGPDRRIPMSQIYDLFLGIASADDVLAAAREGKPAPQQLNERLFYAHLYIGIYKDLHGDKKGALEHLTTAADDHPIGHYMWDVARVHRDLLQKRSRPG